VHALDIGRDMVIAAVNYSYPKLGLSDETRPVRDLDDVRLSIELIRAILEVLDREHKPKTTDLHDTLAQMQLAYAHAVQLAGAEMAAGQEAPPEARRDETPADEAEPEGTPAVESEPEEPAKVQAEEPEAQAEEPPAGAREPAAKRKPAAKKKPAAKRKPAAKKPAPKKKPAGES